MGLDKAFIRIGNKTLIQKQLGILCELHPEECFISGRADTNYGVDGIPIILDETSGKGPLGGIARALSFCKTPLLLVLAVDLPDITSAWFRRLLNHCSAQQGCAAIVGGRWEPLAAAYPQCLLRRFNKHLANGDLSLQHLLNDARTAGQMKALELAEESKNMFRNLNTPDDLENFQDPKVERGNPSGGS